MARDTAAARGFGAAFGGAFGCLAAICVLFMLTIGGCVLMTGGCIAMTAAVPSVNEARQKAREAQARSDAEESTGTMKSANDGPAPWTEEDLQAASRPAANEPGSGSSSLADSINEAAQNIVTKSEYDLLENGMSYEDVARIIGADGEELSRNRIDGVPGVIESVDTVMMSWQNRDGSNMNATFQNNKLVMKAQFGLRPGQVSGETQQQAEARATAEREAAEREAAEARRAMEQAKREAEDKAKWRTWTSGQYTIRAKFMGKIGGTVKLEKEDGTVIDVPAERLSDADNLWITERGWEQ